MIFAFSSPIDYNEGVSLKLYLVSCDLLQPGDYHSLKERLRALGATAVMDRQWALRSTFTAIELKDILKEYLDGGDRLVVAEVGTEWASRRALINLGTL